MSLRLVINWAWLNAWANFLRRRASQYFIQIWMNWLDKFINYFIQKNSSIISSRKHPSSFTKSINTKVSNLQAAIMTLHVTVYHWNPHGGYNVIVRDQSNDLEINEIIPSDATYTTKSYPDNVIIRSHGHPEYRKNTGIYCDMVLLGLTICNRFGLNVNEIKPLSQEPRLHGSLYYKIRDKNGAMYFIKTVCAAYSKDDINRACQFVNIVENILSIKGYQDGNVYFAKFFPSIENDFQYTVHYNNSYWVCSQYINDSRTVLDDNVLLPTRQNKRIAMARVLGTLHSFKNEARNLVNQIVPHPSMANWVGHDKNRCWDWIGNVESRLQRTGDHIWSPGLKNLFMTRANRMDALPKYPSTGDIQSKNIMQAENHSLFLIDHETIVPLSRMWDIYWLLVLDDFGSGVKDTGFLEGEQNLKPTWAIEFASALQCYMSYCKIPFTEEEVFLFHNMCQIKAGMVASVSGLFGDRAEEAKSSCLAIVNGLHNNKDVLRSILSSMQSQQGVYPSIPHIVNNSSRAGSYFPIVVNKLVNKNGNTGRSPILLHYNGTFCPIHRGHIQAIVFAAKFAERHFGNVVGTLLSPCFSSHAEWKASGSSFTLSQRDRISAITLAINSCEAIEEGINNFNPFVDTTEFHNYQPGDLTRVKVVMEKFLESCKLAGCNEQPILCCILGSDADAQTVRSYININPNMIKCIVMPRKDQPANQALVNTCNVSNARFIDADIIEHGVTLNSSKIREVIMNKSSRYENLEDTLQINSVSSFLWRNYHATSI